LRGLQYTLQSLSIASLSTPHVQLDHLALRLFSPGSGLGHAPLFGKPIQL